MILGSAPRSFEPQHPCLQRTDSDMHPSRDGCEGYVRTCPVSARFPAGNTPELLVPFLPGRPLLPFRVLPAHLGDEEKTPTGQQQMGPGWEQRERKTEEEIKQQKKQTENKQQRPSESPRGRRHVKPRDTAVSAHVLHHPGYQAPLEATRPGGTEEEEPHTVSPRANM